MRKTFIYYLLILGACLLVANKGIGQITITKANMPVAGQNYIYSTSNDSIDVSQTGANQVWDFSGIVPVSQDTFKYVTALKANPLYALSFNGDAALDIKTQGFSGLYSFFKTAAAGYVSEGYGITLPVVKLPTSVVFTSPDIIYHFPLNYSDSDSCVYAGSASLSTFSIKIAGSRHNVVDGWGKIITPYKTYNCIRVKSIVNEIDTILVAGVNNSHIEYKWLATSENIPVFEADVTPSPTGGQTMTLNYRDSYKQIVNPNGPQVDFNVPDTNVFAKDTVTFNNATTGALTYSWVIKPATFSYVGNTTATSKNPQVIFNAYGLYTVSLNATGIGGTNYLTKTDYINVGHSAGIQRVAGITNGMEIYPNPAGGEVYLHFNDRLGAGQTSVSVLNTFGQTVIHQTAAQGINDIRINLNGIAPGVYFVQCNNGVQSYMGRVVVR